MRKGNPFLIFRFRDFEISFSAAFSQISKSQNREIQNQKFLSSAEGPYIDGIAILFIRI